ncbi:MAG: heavy metal translocating P-type ATPase [Desulfurivibrionaceae bacterium]
MLQHRQAEPLLKFHVLHAIEGRIRIGCRALAFLGQYNEEIIGKLAEIEGVQDITISNITANILISYDSKWINQESLIDAVSMHLSIYSFHAHREEAASKNQQASGEREVAAESILSLVRALGATTLVLGTSFLSRGRPLAIVPGLGRLGSLRAIAALVLASPIFRSGLRSIRLTGRPNADSLSSAAIFSSVLIGQSNSALAVIFLHQIAELLTAYTMKRTKSAVREMLAGDKDYTWRVTEDGLEKITVTAVEKDDHIMVHAGEKIGVDGNVVRGSGLVDQAAITGEYMPVVMKKGDTVYAGTTVREGTLTIAATRVGVETAVTNIVRMVESATDKKAPVQNYADRFSSSLLLFNIFLFGLVYALTRSMPRALGMLVIDYSCGIRLSTAAALSASINTAAKNSVFIKDSGSIELLSKADTLVLDKTGTVTKGAPEVVSIVPANEKITPKDVLRTAAAAEETSNHPMARAIAARVKNYGWPMLKHGDINIITGKGVETRIGRSIVRVGNKKFMNDNGLHTHDFRNRTQSMALNGENIVYVARGKRVIGVLGISDPLRDRMKKSLNRLRMAGIDDIVMLTGDLEQHAEIVANRMSMDRFESEQLPEDKARAVVQIQAEGATVVMVGDGINDAAGLAYADVGVALGRTRTDIAMESADITISGDNPMMLPAVFQLSENTMKIIRQNFASTFGINSVALALGAVGILPVFWGAVLHNSSTILVVANSLRLLWHEM